MSQPQIFWVQKLCTVEVVRTAVNYVSIYEARQSNNKYVYGWWFNSLLIEHIEYPKRIKKKIVWCLIFGENDW